VRVAVDSKAMKFVLGFLTGGIAAVAIPLVVLTTGSFNVAATAKPSTFEKKIAPWALARAVKKQAPHQTVPFNTNDPAVLQRGLIHYREECAVCHGAPGLGAAALSKGLNPDAPMLDAPDVQKMSDGELFWVIKNGIRMTGMPAFGRGRKDEELWKIVAFIRHLDKLSAEESARLRVHHHAED
jgi:mono/diheme cytochrome c family protein